MSIISMSLPRYISRKLKKLWNLPFVANKLNLSVAKQASLHNQLIGLDRVKRKLLLIKKAKDKFHCCIIDLKDVQHCSVKKVYGGIKAGDLQKKGLGYYLQSISLQLGLKNRAKPVTINFYESNHNTMKQQSMLESAAKKWEQFVSELLPKRATLAVA